VPDADDCRFATLLPATLGALPGAGTVWRNGPSRTETVYCPDGLTVGL
jgi:hypothetical protein